MAGEGFEGAVPLAVLPVDRRLKHNGAMVGSASERRVDVCDADPDYVGDLTGLRRPALCADVGDDHGSVVADGQLGAMALADPSALNKAESGAQKPNCGARGGTDGGGQ